MSDREKALELLEKVPDYKLGYVIAFIQGLIAGEIADLDDIRAAREEYAAGQTANHDAIDWD